MTAFVATVTTTVTTLAARPNKATATATATAYGGWTYVHALGNLGLAVGLSNRQAALLAGMPTGNSPANRAAYAADFVEARFNSRRDRATIISHKEGDDGYFTHQVVGHARRGPAGWGGVGGFAALRLCGFAAVRGRRLCGFAAVRGRRLCGFAALRL